MYVVGNNAVILLAVSNRPGVPYELYELQNYMHDALHSLCVCAEQWNLHFLTDRPSGWGSLLLRYYLIFTAHWVRITHPQKDSFPLHVEITCLLPIPKAQCLPKISRHLYSCIKPHFYLFVCFNCTMFPEPIKIIKVNLSQKYSSADKTETFKTDARVETFRQLASI